MLVSKEVDVFLRRLQVTQMQSEFVLYATAVTLKKYVTAKSSLL